MAVDSSGNVSGDYPALNKLRRHYERRYELQDRGNQKRIDRLARNYQENIERLKQNHEENEANLKERLVQSRENFREQEAKLKERIDRLAEEYKYKTEDQHHEFAEQIDRLSEEYGKAREHLIQERNFALAERDDRYERRVDELSKQQRAALQEFVDKVNAAMNEDREINAKYRHSLRSQQKSIRDTEDRKHSQELQELRTEMSRRDVKHSKNMDTMRNEFQRERELDKSVQKAAVDKVRNNYQNIVDQLQLDALEKNKEHSAILGKKEDEIADLKTRQQQQLAHLDQKHTQELEFQRTHYDRLNKNLQTAAANEVMKAQEKAILAKEQMAENYNRRLQRAIDDKQEQLDKYMKQTEKGIFELRDNAVRREGEIENRRQQEVFNLKQEATARAVRDRENYDRLVSDVRHQLTTELNEVSDRHEDDRQRLKKAYNEELQEVREAARHRDEMAQLRYLRDRDRMNKNKERLLQELNMAKEDQAASFREKIKQQDDAYQELRKITDRRIATTERTHEKEREHLNLTMENMEKQHAADRKNMAAQMQTGIKEKVAYITSEFQDQISDLTRRAQAKEGNLKRQNESITTAYKNEIARLNQRNEELSGGQTSSARKAFDNHRREMQATIDKLEKQASEARATSQQAAKEDIYRINMAKDVERFEAQMNQRIRNNQEKYQQQSNFRKRINSLENNLEATKLETSNQLKNAKERFASYIQNETAENSRQRALDRINNDALMASKAQAYEEKIESLNRSYENLLKEQERNSRRTLLAQKANYEKQIEDLNKAHARELQNKLDIAAKNKAAVEQELRSQNNYTIDVYEKKLAKLKETYARNPNVKTAF